MATTYCARADLESIVGMAAVLAQVDDDQTGTESAGTGTSPASASPFDAIVRAAVEMNAAMRMQYKLSDLAGNDWCKWCNAYLACYYLWARKSNAPPPSVVENVNSYRELLDAIRWGRAEIPEQNPSFEHIATVSNFSPELMKSFNPVRVVKEESTGATPVGGRKRNVAGHPGDL